MNLNRTTIALCIHAALSRYDPWTSIQISTMHFRFPGEMFKPV